MSRFAQSHLIWKPINPAFTNVEVFRRMINRKHGLNLKDYADLHNYSVQDYAFWLDLWEYLGIIYSMSPEKIIVSGVLKEVPLWFPCARLNYAENLLHRDDDAVSCTMVRESGVVAHYSFKRLRQLVADTAAAMRVNGLAVGDRVAAIVTNSITAVVLALATASIGGIYSSTAPDMGRKGIIDRYSQIRPKFIFAETEIVYAGKTIDLLPKVSAIIQDLSENSLQLAVLLPSTQTNKEITINDLRYCISFSNFIATGDGRALSFEQLPFNHPLCILYSSGTSGPPKCIVHSTGGILLQTKKDIGFGFGITADDTLLQYTTTGWMMWTLMLAGLSWGARLILYDGSPFYPDLPTFLRLVSDQGVTVLGVSPRFLTEAQGQGINPAEVASFESIRTIASGGAVLTAPVHAWSQKAFGAHVRVMSATGGTDICSSFVTSSSSLPVYAGEISCKSLGMKVEVFDPFGRNIEHTGEAGEMVCTRPHPSIPLCFWGDASGEKFRDAYFDMFPGVWRQGDFMAINPSTKGILILGRSDGVLNPSGVRFGSSEIYAVLEQFSAHVNDSLCISQRRPHDVDERVLLFLRMRSGHKLTKSLIDHIRDAIRVALTARHVPEYVFEVEDIPYTVNGKKIEIAVKLIVSGKHVAPSSAVANPESLRLYYKYYDIK